MIIGNYFSFTDESSKQRCLPDRTKVILQCVMLRFFTVY